MAIRPQPNGPGHWRRALGGMDPSEILAMRGELDELESRPAFAFLRSTLGEARDDLIRLMVNGRILEHPEYAKQAGLIAGYEDFDTLIGDIHHAADQVEKAREAAIADGRPRLEAVS